MPRIRWIERRQAEQIELLIHRRVDTLLRHLLQRRLTITQIRHIQLFPLG
jgi:hypothetical protein